MDLGEDETPTAAAMVALANIFLTFMSKTPRS
jgi:hypothetical protein